MVRVKDGYSPINGRKLKVSSVKFGTKLAPGQNISFMPDETGTLALDVQVMPLVEAPAKTSTLAVDKKKPAYEVIVSLMKEIITYIDKNKNREDTYSLSATYIIGYFSALTTVLWKIVISDRRRKEIVNELREFQSQLRESHWARQVIDDCINESHCNENLDN